MPAKFPLSGVKSLGFDFDHAVKDYKTQLDEFLKRPSDWDPIPAPVPPHPWVSIAAMAADGYEIHDDTPPPPPPPTLEQQKHNAALILQQAAQAAIDAVAPPPLKRALFDIQLAEAQETPKEQRTLPQREIINNARGIHEQQIAIRLKLAQLLDQIADMDADAFSAFTSRPAPTFTA